MSLIKTNNANIKISGGKLSSGIVSGGGGGGGGGGSSAVFWENWTTLPTIGNLSFGQTTYQGSCTFSINNNNLEIDDRAGLTSFNAMYSYIGGGGAIDASNCTNLTNMHVPAAYASSVDVSNCTSLTILEISYNDLGSPNGLNVTNCPNLTQIFAWSINFSTEQVNNLLAQLVQNGASNASLFLGGNSSPTGQGLTDKAILESRNWTINGI